MTFNEYQQQALKTAIYPQNYKIVYPSIGLSGETGEVSEKIKKVLRDNNGNFSKDKCQEIAKELGDCLWYIANLSSDIGYSLDDIAEMNINKIISRQQNNQIHGNGDDR